MFGPTLAAPGCEACYGTGKVIGFGRSNGKRCSCIASCEVCDKDFAWTHDDEKAPAMCPACENAVEGEEVAS